MLKNSQHSESGSDPPALDVCFVRGFSVTGAGGRIAESTKIAAFADSGSLRLSAGLRQVWDEQFSMILRPDTEDGLGTAILNSNSEAHFSFTNALGMISVGQMHRLTAAICNFPRARWIVALHHHLAEYPRSMAALSERVGTAPINGSWFGAGNELSPDLHESPHFFAMAGPLVNYFHCVWIDE